MEHTVCIARFLCAMYIIMGIGFLIDPSYYHKLIKDAMKSNLFMYLGAFLSLALGLVIIAKHNIVVSGWPMLITLIGYLAFAKGIVLIWFPRLMTDFATTVYKSEKAVSRVGIFAVILGILFGYIGFFSMM